MIELRTLGVAALLGPDGSGVRPILAQIEELRGHGHLAAGRALCERGVRWYEPRPTSQQAAFGSRASVARLFCCAERRDQARAAYERLAAEDSSEGGRRLPERDRLSNQARRARRATWLTAQVARIERWLVALAHADPLLEPLRGYPPIRALLYGDR